MFSNPKSSRSAAIRRLRRGGLAALLITCGTLGSAAAEDGGQKSSINLRSLPPLPVGIGQLAQVSPGGTTAQSTAAASSNSAQIRVNPYANNHPLRQANSQPQHSTTVLRQVSGFTPVSPESKVNDSTARLIRQPASTLSLKPVENAVIENAAVENAAVQAPAAVVNQFVEPQPESPQVAQQVLPMDVARHNPWVGGQQAQPIALEPAIEPNFDSPLTPVGASDQADEPAAQRAHFKLSDDNSFERDTSATEQGSFHLGDGGGAVVLDAAPLLKIAPPTLLQVAEPVQLEQLPEETATAEQAPSYNSFVRDGDVRSATGRVEVRRRQVEDQQVMPSLEDVDIQQGFEELESAEEELVQSKSEDAIGFAAIPSSDLPVPQIYRPQQSLVIDVPTAKPSIDQVSSETDLSERPNASHPIFDRKIADVISVKVAQSEAFTPSEPVRRVQLENRDVCEAVLVGSHKLLLIGRSQGATRLAIWCGEGSEPQLYEIQVVAGREATPGSTLDAIAKRLTETIAATYQSCQVQVVPHGEGLAVIGRASDAKSAREIMRLVRSACLKSVSDRLEVR